MVLLFAVPICVYVADVTNAQGDFLLPCGYKVLSDSGLGVLGGDFALW